jgi:hypothetical protein
MLNELQERELSRLEAKKLDLITRIYPYMPEDIKSISELTGIPEEVLVRTCVHTACLYNDMEWHQIMNIIRSFFLVKRNIESNREEKEEA